MKAKSLIIIILIIVINIVLFNINIVQAAGMSDVISGGDNFISAGSNDKTANLDQKKLKNASNMIYNILLISAICVASIYTVILGIKFMIGSVEEKAQIKDALVPFIIGCIVAFGAFGIWKIFITIGNSLHA